MFFLIDFGAVANPMLQSGGSTVAGTYGYMHPEQLMGKPAPESDIYALAATLVYMLSGTEPSDIQVADFRLLIDPYLECVPRPVVVLLLQMLDPDKKSRLCDHDTLIRTFEQFADNQFIEEYALTSAGLSDEVIEQKLYNLKKI